MLKFAENTKGIIYENLKKKDLLDKKDIISWITNRYLTLVLELEFFTNNKVANIINRSFSPDELKYYCEVYLKKEKVEEFDAEYVRYISLKTGLNTEERREKYRLEVRELTDLVLKIISGDSEAYWEFNKKYEEYTYERENSNLDDVVLRRFIPLGIVISLVRNQANPLELENSEKSTTKNLRPFHARYIISDFKYEMGCLLGLRRRRKDTTELIDSFKQMVEDSTEVEEEAEETLESVKLERDQYKSSLILIQRSLDELSEKLKEETENIASEQIRDFFVSLNSAKYGNFLDKIPLTEDLLKDIRRNEKDYDIPQEVKRVLIFIKSVIKFIKDQGITPIEEINRVFEGTAEDIAEMDYVGEEFIDDEVKKLKVIAPGYKYKDLIISIPKVEEVNE